MQEVVLCRFFKKKKYLRRDKRYVYEIERMEKVTENSKIS